MSPTRKSRPRPAPRRTSRKPAASAPAPRRARQAAAGPAAGSGLAPGLQAGNTYLAVANVDASITFLERAFGFTRGVVL